tara:strand:- start:2470 stop:2772 length:303 start_codon:yes stop_codon:yes gene_type:complete
MDTAHSTYNVLLPETTITAIKEEAETNGVSSAQVVRDVLADGLGGEKKRGGIRSWCDAIKLAIQTVRDAYPVPRFADGKTLGDQIAGKIEAALEKGKGAG